MSARRADLAPVVEAGQRVAGLLAARGRGDRDGAAALMAGFADDRELAGGALLVAELCLAQLGAERGEDVGESVRRLCVDMEAALG